MKIALTNDEGRIFVHTDFKEMDEGLIGQTLVELEMIKQELIGLYRDTGEEDA